jgi:hypothetical protein
VERVFCPTVATPPVAVTWSRRDELRELIRSGFIVLKHGVIKPFENPFFR